MAESFEAGREGPPTRSESASDGYQTDSERYQAEEEEVAPDAEKDIARRILELTEGQEWDEFGLPKQRSHAPELDPEGGWMPDEALGAALARMLINRGAEAVLNAHRAELAPLRRLDPEG